MKRNSFLKIAVSASILVLLVFVGLAWPQNEPIKIIPAHYLMPRTESWSSSNRSRMKARKPFFTDGMAEESSMSFQS